MLGIFITKTKIYFLAFFICIVFSSCGNSGGDNDAKTIVKFSNIQEFTANVPLKPQSLKVIDGFVSSIKEDNKDMNTTADLLAEYSYDDIKFEKHGNTYTILNNTPTPINGLTIDYNKSDVALLKFSKQIPSFHDASFSILDSGEFNNIKYDNQMSLFLPYIQQADRINRDCTGIAGCESSPTKYQESLYRIIVLNIHNAVNELAFSKKIHSFFKDNCQNFDLCVEYMKVDPKLSYATRSTLQFGSNKHSLHLYVTQDYAYEGAGSGGRPNLDLYKDNSSGYASLYQAHVNPPKLASNDDSWNYYGFFHEICHGYFFNHAAGDSKYVKGNGASGMNSFNQYGFDKMFREWQKSNPDKDRISALKVPKIFVKAESAGSNQVILKYYYIPTNFAYDNLDVKLIANTPISGNMSVSGNEIKISLSNYLQIPLYIRSSSKDYTYESTLRLKHTKFANLKKYYIGGIKYTVLDKNEILNKNASARDVIKICSNINEPLATRAQYQILWNYLQKNNKLDELEKKVFLASDGPNGATSWRLTFTDDFMKHFSDWVDVSKPFGSDKGIVCLSPE